MLKYSKRQVHPFLKKILDPPLLLVYARDQTSVIEQNSLSQDGKKEDRNEEVTEVSMKLFLVFVCQDVILWSLSMKDIN